jgi:hypothetical protein
MIVVLSHCVWRQFPCGSSNRNQWWQCRPNYTRLRMKGCKRHWGSLTYSTEKERNKMTQQFPNWRLEGHFSLRMGELSQWGERGRRPIEAHADGIWGAEPWAEGWAASAVTLEEEGMTDLTRKRTENTVPTWSKDITSLKINHNSATIRQE